MPGIKGTRSHNKASRRKQRRGKHTRSRIATSRRSGLGYQEFLNWGTSGWCPEDNTRLSQRVWFPTLSRPHPGESPDGSFRVKRKRPATRNRELGEGSCLRPSVPCQTKQDLAEGRAVDRFVVSRGVGLESPAITGEVPEQQLPKTLSARNAKVLVSQGTSQEALS